MKYKCGGLIVAELGRCVFVGVRVAWPGVVLARALFDNIVDICRRSKCMGWWNETS